MTDQLAIWRVHEDGKRAHRIDCLDAGQRFYDLTEIPFDETEAMLEEHGRVDGYSTFNGDAYTLLPAGVVWTPVVPEGEADPDTAAILFVKGAR